MRVRAFRINSNQSATRKASIDDVRLNTTQKKLGIVRITPTVLDVGQVWFAQNNRLLQKQARNPFSWWSKNYKVIQQYERISMSVLLRTLADWGYQKVVTVHNPGEYARRGGIIDIFPINEPYAFRVEFNGSTVETIFALTHITTDPEQALKKVVAQSPVMRYEKSGKQEQAYKEILSSLKKDSYVVHIDHGIGIFRGVEARNETQYLVIEYASGDMLRVPVATIGRVTPYIGFANPSITRLGGNWWEKTKQKVKEDLLKVAQELLEIYAQRELATKNSYAQSNALLSALESSFEFVETPDQARAMDHVYNDLRSATPMDRVIVADVGFGKTEVALRASALAVESGYQVALIAPTTILAHQHHKLFTNRFAQTGYPVAIEKLTRIEGRLQQRQTLEHIQKNKVDIVIGTHRLLQKDIQFARLGLLIIDEEQRFGVKQKEVLKSYKTDVDILSLSATPIPRTLSSALSGIRDLSVIATPPRERKSIQTTVQPFQDALVKTALKQELDREGQVYYLHNRILSLRQTVEYLQKLAPQARIASIHSKMSEQRIIETIDAFAERAVDILVSTTIMENGLDMANANTLIVDNATKLGLAQLHQIRGRIGRGEKQAYAYLLYPQQKLAEKARDRLEALEAYQELGAGYEIAMRDLEIRGAGNLLGKAQSGNVARVGFNLYCQLLNEAVEQMRKRK